MDQHALFAPLDPRFSIKKLGYLRKAISLIAYCPLAQGEAAESEGLARIGAKHGTSAAQIALAWLFGKEGVVAIPKAGRAISHRANLEALSLALETRIAKRSHPCPSDSGW